MARSLDEIEKDVRDRLKALEPLVKEAEGLRRVAASFEATRASGSGGKGSPGATSRSAAGRRRGRPPGSTAGSRRAMALRLVIERPGITVAELADEMGIGTTYLYRVMPALEREGKVRKVRTGYEPVPGSS